MQITYAITLKELRSLRRRYAWHKHKLGILFDILFELIFSYLAGTTIVLPLLLLLWAVKHENTGPSEALMWTFSFVSTVVVLAVSGLITNWIFHRKTRKDYESFPPERKLVVLPEHLLIETKLSKTECKWAGVSEAEFYSDWIFAYVKKQLVVVVPKRAFSSEHEAETFISLIHQYRSASTKEQST